MKTLAVLLGVALVGGAFGASVFEPTWESLAQHATPAWFESSRLGIFCHWGVQCVPENGDWYARRMYIGEEEAADYFDAGDLNHGKFHRAHYGDPKTFGFKDLIPLWKAEKWDPEKLCDLYREMGAGYIVALANHHDNFDNWDSAYQPWNSVNMGPKRDIIGDWAKAARSHGLKFGVSVHAMHVMGWMEPSRKYDGLLTRADGKGTWWEGYDPQDLYEQLNHEPSTQKKDLYFWWWDHHIVDIPETFVSRFYLRTMDLIGKYRPDLVYYDNCYLPLWPRSDVGLRLVADYYNAGRAWHQGRDEVVVTSKNLTEKMQKAVTLDLERSAMPGPVYPHWQTDTCIGEWHYDRKVYDKDGYKSAAIVLRVLADVVAKNGNLLLSVPLRADGSIDEKELAICREIAAWMKACGECVKDVTVAEPCAEGPLTDAIIQHQGEAFNERYLPEPTADDVRYTRRGETLYAIALVPPKADAIPEFVTRKGPSYSRVYRLPQVGDCPAVWRFEK